MLHRVTYLIPVIVYVQKFLIYVVPVIRYVQKCLTYVMPVIRYVELSKKKYPSYKVCSDAAGICNACHKVC